MNISVAKNLQELLEIKLKELTHEASNFSQKDIERNFNLAMEQTFQTDLYRDSLNLSASLQLDCTPVYSIMNSIQAVDNYIGDIWEGIHMNALLITDDQSFDYASTFFPQFRNLSPRSVCNISDQLTSDKLQYLIDKCLKENEINYIVSLGGGRVMDIQKFIGFKAKKKMIAFPTSLASHVYASPKIHALPVIKEFGYDLTIDGLPPHLAFLDIRLLDHLYSENPRLIFAGLGDISAFITAKYDWILSKSRDGADRNYFVESLIEDVITWLKNFSADKPFQDWVKDYHLIQALLCNITDWEGSAPASGSEHLFALSVETYTEQSLPLHGELVALGVIIMSDVQENCELDVAKLIKGLGLPTTLSVIGIDREIIIKGFIDSLPKGKKKGRYTILNEISNHESKIKEVLDSLIEKKILQD
jgi:glycerol-1-phosphate dehydrogenase [NAD(P)+]